MFCYLKPVYFAIPWVYLVIFSSNIAYIIFKTLQIFNEQLETRESKLIIELCSIYNYEIACLDG